MQSQKKKCLNCGAELDKHALYCSHCGQKVDENNLAVSSVIKEFFENYLSFDSRFGRSIIPFLFKPGYLSKRFIEGKRRNFANPFRLYILSSLLFFFSVSSFIKVNQDQEAAVIRFTPTQLNRFEALSKESYDILNQELSSKTKNNLNEHKDSSFAYAFKQLKPMYKKNVLVQLKKEEIFKLGIEQDTLLLNETFSFHSSKSTDGVQAETDLGLGRIEPYLKDLSYSDEQLYDSLGFGDNVSPMKELLFRQMIKVKRADAASFNRYIFGNMSIAMFVLIPLFALFMKLLYLKRNQFYVAHLIHVVYIQSFSFILFGFFLGLAATIPQFNVASFKKVGLIICFLIFSIHFFVSLRKVYEQKRLKTFVKGGLLVGMYLFLGLIVAFGEVFVSFILF